MKRFRSRYYDGLRLIRSLTIRRLINLLLLEATYLLARYFKVFLFPGGPAAISVEPTTSCNLRCPECPSGLRRFTRPTGVISTESYRCWLHQHKSNLIWLNLYFQGEPFLHSDFFSLIRLAKEHRYYTMTSTNAHFLTEENCSKLISSGLDRLIVSVDGLDQQTYEQYRRGGNLGVVMKGIEMLAGAKQERGSSHPYIQVQSLVLRSNEHQMEELKKRLTIPGVDEIVFKSAQIYDYSEGSELIPDTDKYSRYRKTGTGGFEIKSKAADYCRKLWFSSVITWDGVVVPCCYDKDARYRMGTLASDLFPVIWKSDKYVKFRKNVFSKRSCIDICENCGERIEY